MALFSATRVKNARHPRLSSPTHGALPGSSFARRPESGASRHLPPLRGLRHSVAAHCQRARRSRHHSGLPRRPEPSGVLHSTENSPRSEGPSPPPNFQFPLLLPSPCGSHNGLPSCGSLALQLTSWGGGVFPPPGTSSLPPALLRSPPNEA